MEPVSKLTGGAVKEGSAVSASRSATAGPDFCVQVMVSASPSESVALPSSVTSELSGTVCVGPAFATGGKFTFPTVIVTVSVAACALPLETLTWKTNEAPAGGTAGVRKVEMAVFGLESVTGTPESCVQLKLRGSAGVF